MIQEKYSFPLPNCGEDYKLTKKELTSLLDTAWQNGYDTAWGNFNTEVATITTCDGCHRIIKDSEDCTEVVSCDSDGNEIVSHWCTKCRREFVKDLEKPATTSFSEAEPHLLDTLVRNMETYLKI